MKNESVYDRMTYAERAVAKVLKEFDIKWSYEQPVFVWDNDNRPRVWTPDFYLVSFGIYVEVCGSDKFNYEYRRKIFERNGYKVIFLHLYEDFNKWTKHLFIYLKLFTKNRYRELINLNEK